MMTRYKKLTACLIAGSILTACDTPAQQNALMATGAVTAFAFIANSQHDSRDAMPSPYADSIDINASMTAITAPPPATHWREDFDMGNINRISMMLDGALKDTDKPFIKIGGAGGSYFGCPVGDDIQNNGNDPHNNCELRY